MVFLWGLRAVKTGVPSRRPFFQTAPSEHFRRFLSWLSGTSKRHGTVTQEPLMPTMLLGSVTFQVLQETPEVAKCESLKRRFISMRWQNNSTLPPMFLFHIYSLSQTKKEALNYIGNNWEQAKNGTSTSPPLKCLLHVQQGNYWPCIRHMSKAITTRPTPISAGF